MYSQHRPPPLHCSYDNCVRRDVWFTVAVGMHHSSTRRARRRNWPRRGRPYSGLPFAVTPCGGGHDEQVEAARDDLEGALVAVQELDKLDGLEDVLVGLLEETRGRAHQHAGIALDNVHGALLAEREQSCL